MILYVLTLICTIFLCNYDLNFQVAEFANVRKQLEVLEDRLDSLVQPRLTDALSNRRVPYLTPEIFICCSPFPLTSYLLIFLFC